MAKVTIELTKAQTQEVARIRGLLLAVPDALSALGIDERGEGSLKQALKTFSVARASIGGALFETSKDEAIVRVSMTGIALAQDVVRFFRLGRVDLAEKLADAALIYARQVRDDLAIRPPD